MEKNGDFWPVEKTVLDPEEDDVGKLIGGLYAVKLGYQLPFNCTLLYDPALRFKFRQVCGELGAPYTAWEWLLTAKPGLFGLVKGWANPTGFGLLAAVTIMTVCSMPFVRRSGKFQVFFFTHLLYWVYAVLLILHAPVFWICILLPLAIFVVEKLYRAASTLMGQGRSAIEEGIPLASK